MAKIFQTFYISTGAKNVMYTLRCSRTAAGLNPNFAHDWYIKTLAATEEKAIEKAREYFEAFVERIGHTDDENCVMQFDSCPENEPRSRRGKLSAAETDMIEDIEAGISPWGKHKGMKIADLPENYILFFADKFGQTDRFVSEAFAAACLGVALENGYIAKREAVREERRNADLLSQHVGEVGQRLTFEGVVESCYFKDSYEGGYHINKIRCGNDIIIYFGKALGERDQTIKLKGTIKKHNEREGVQSTQINRPSIINK